MMLLVLMDLYDLLNNNKLSKEDIKKKLLAYIEQELEKEKKALKEYEDNRKDEFIEIEKRILNEFNNVNIAFNVVGGVLGKIMFDDTDYVELSRKNNK